MVTLILIALFGVFGHLVGYFLTIPLIGVLSGALYGLAAHVYLKFREAELGSIFSMVAVYSAIAYTCGLAISLIIVYGSPIDLSMIIREGAW